MSYAYKLAKISDHIKRRYTDPIKAGNGYVIGDAQHLGGRRLFELSLIECFFNGFELFNLLA